MKSEVIILNFKGFCKERYWALLIIPPNLLCEGGGDRLKTKNFILENTQFVCNKKGGNY